MGFDCSDPTHPLASVGFPGSSCSNVTILTNAIDAMATFLCDEFISSSSIEFRRTALTDSTSFTALFGVQIATHALVLDGDGYFWYTTNSGANWTRIEDGLSFIQTSGTDDTLFTALFSGDILLFSMVLDGDDRLWYTVDTGTTWTRVTQPLEVAAGVSGQVPTISDFQRDGDVPSDHLLFATPTELWFSDDGGTSFTVMSFLTIISDLLVNIQAFLAGSILQRGAFYRVIDNTHAGGGDLMAQALDVDILSNTGLYYHASRDVWFPMTWNPITGEILELYDPLYNNRCIGVNSVDDFEWDVNDTLGGAWTNNTIEDCDITYAGVVGYGILDNNTFINSILVFGNYVNTCSGNTLVNSSLTIDNALVGSMSTNSNRLFGSDLFVSNVYGSFLNNTMDFSIVNLTDNPNPFIFTNNRMDYTTFDISNSSTGAITRNTIIGSVISMDNLDSLTTFSNNSIQNSTITYTDIDDTDFESNQIFGAIIDILQTGAGANISSNVFSGSDLSINNASFTGAVTFNTVVNDSALTFGAHTGTFNKNLIQNSTITGTKTGATTATGNTFINTVATVTAGSNVNATLFADTAVVINDAGADVDVRMESDTDSNAWFHDGTGVGAVGQGTASPTAFNHMRASTTAMATYRVPSGTSPTSPNEGDVWNDSTQKAMQMFEDGIKQSINGTIFTQTASVTVANTGTETTLIGAGVGSMTLPANFLTVGKTIRVVAGGFYGTDAVAPNMVLRLKLGATTILQQDAGGTLTAGIGNDRGWMFTGEFTIRAVGAAGNAIGTGIAWFSIGGTAQKSYPFQMLAVSGAFNTTGTLALALTADWDTGDADNTITCTHLSATILN